MKSMEKYRLKRVSDISESLVKKQKKVDVTYYLQKRYMFFLWKNVTCIVSEYGGFGLIYSEHDVTAKSNTDAINILEWYKLGGTVTYTVINAKEQIIWRHPSISKDMEDFGDAKTELEKCMQNKFVHVGRDVEYLY